MSQSPDTAALGAWGEDLAADYLRRRGMAVLERNWRCRAGEVDIVARDGGVLVVCEVKTRRGEGFGGPLHAVGRHKHQRLRRLAAAWLAERRVSVEGIRIDVIGVVACAGARPRLTHIEGVG